MIDRFKRKITYMRVSVTDRCNLRCRYCMPVMIKKLEMEEILTYEEIARLCRIGASLGIENIRLTGGEPLVRPECFRLVSILKKLPGIKQVTMTTNGILLKENLEKLLKAGLDGVNISLDTLNQKEFTSITGFDELPQVLEAVELCLRRGLKVKLNTVLLKKPDWENYGTMVEYALQRGIDLRFIEMMPVGFGRKYQSYGYWDFLAELKKKWPLLKKDTSDHGPGPAIYYRIDEGKGGIGFISAIHEKFCSGCNRVRLTSTGFLKTCLCYDEGTNLKILLRGNADDDLIKYAFFTAVFNKPAGHCFETLEKVTEKNGMYAIGG